MKMRRVSLASCDSIHDHVYGSCHSPSHVICRRASENQTTDTHTHLTSLEVELERSRSQEEEEEKKKRRRT